MELDETAQLLVAEIAIAHKHVSDPQVAADEAKFAVADAWITKVVGELVDHLRPLQA